jgi:hypothetical protein
MVESGEPLPDRQSQGAEIAVSAERRNAVRNQRLAKVTLAQKENTIKGIARSTT